MYYDYNGNEITMADIYTDDKVKEEVLKTLSNPQLRQCSHCIYGADYTTCAKLHIPISRFQYCGHCQHFITNEEKLIREAKEAMEKRDKETKKDDRLLTLSYTSVEMSIIYLEHFEARIEAEYNHALKRIEAKCKKLNQRITEEDQEYLRDKKKEYKRLSAYIESLKNALKKMDFHIKEARKQFVHMVEPKLNKAFFDEEHTAFKAEEYDTHGEDVFEMAEVNLKYFDATYMDEHNGRKVIDFIDSLPSNRILDAEDYKRYKMKT